VYTVRYLAKLTNLTSRQVYDRIAALSPILNGSLRTGTRGAKLLTDEGFAIFRRLIELESEGISRESIVKVIESELETSEPNKPEAVRKDRESVGDLVQTLQAVIEDQRQEIAFLRRQIELLTPLALPSPRRGLCPVPSNEGNSGRVRRFCSA